MTAPTPSLELAMDALSILMLLADRKFGRGPQRPLVHRLDDANSETTTSNE